MVLHIYNEPSVVGGLLKCPCVAVIGVGRLHMMGSSQFIIHSKTIQTITKNLKFIG